MSPAAIVSAMHQHIVYGARPWEVGKLNMPKQEPTRQGKAPAQGEQVPAPGFVKPLLGRSTSAGLPLKRPPLIPTSTAADLEALADDLEAHATTTSEPDALPRIYRKQSLRPRLLAILANTQDAASAWAAYRALLAFPRSADKARPKVPLPHRHRLLRLLAATPRPRPRGRYAQVLAVLRALQDMGGTIQQWEWNLLLDCAGKEGWRRPREEHFRAALALLAEMRAVATEAYHALPGVPEVAPGGEERKRKTIGIGAGGAGGDVGGRTTTTTATPDIFSYTTLLAHAVRTRAPAAVRHAAQLLARAGLAPGPYAHTALLCFFAQRRDLAGVRDTLFRMRRQEEGGAGLAQVAFNVVLWAFAYNGRLDVARAMYRVVRARVVPLAECRRPEEEEEEDVAVLESTLAEREMIVVAPEVIPDTATYHILIQAYAYHGDLRASVETLTDMLSASTPHLLHGNQNHHHHHRHRQQEEQETSSHVTAPRRSSLTAFRAIFLGFARHGVLSPHAFTSAPSSESLVGISSSSSSSEWTLATLEALFARFLELPHDTPLRETVLFWLVSAFARTSGNDAAVLRDVFKRVEDRFGCGHGWSGRLARIREKVFSS